MKKSTFVVKKKIELAFLGEGWEQAYITFNPFTLADNEELLKLRTNINIENPEATPTDEIQTSSDKLIEMLANKLVEGKGFDGEKLVDITSENIGDLPLEILTHSLDVLQGKKTLLPNG